MGRVSPHLVCMVGLRNPVSIQAQKNNQCTKHLVAPMPLHVPKLGHNHCRKHHGSSRHYTNWQSRGLRAMCCMEQTPVQEVRLRR